MSDASSQDVEVLGERDIPRLFSGGAARFVAAYFIAAQLRSLFWPHHAPAHAQAMQWHPGLLDAVVCLAIGFSIGRAVIPRLVPRWREVFLSMRGGTVFDWFVFLSGHGRRLWPKRPTLFGFVFFGTLAVCDVAVWVVCRMTGRIFPPFPYGAFTGTVGVNAMFVVVFYGYARWYDSLPD